MNSRISFPSVTLTTVCRLGVPVRRLGLGQRPLLEEPVDVGPSYGSGLTLLQRATQADVSVGQREQGLGRGQRGRIETGRAQ